MILISMSYLYSMKLTLALAQLYPKLGDLRANLAKHLTYIADAKAQGADLIVFPELSLTGYFLQDLLHEVAIRPNADDPVFVQLLNASQIHDMDIVFGFAEVDARSRYYISAAYLSRGEVVHVHRKAYLPTYGMFIDGRFFTPGERIQAFDTRFGRVGMLICEDFWHVSSPYVLWNDGADLFLFPADSPGRGLTTAPEIGTALWSRQLARTYAELFGSPIVFCNRVGFEDGIHFFGGSLAINADGSTVAEAPTMDEALIVQPLDMSAIRRARAAQPLLRDERSDLVMRELTRIRTEKDSSW